VTQRIQSYNIHNVAITETGTVMVIGGEMETPETSNSKKIEEQNEDELVLSLSAVARYFGVSQPAVSKWKLNGMPRESGGGYNLKKIGIWRALRIGKEADSLLPDKAGNLDAKLIAEVKRELGRFQNLAEIYKEKRGEVFAGVGAKILSTAEQILDGITSKQLRKMNIRDKLKGLKDLITSATSIYEKERLENDQSTENIQLIVAQIKDLKRREAEERKREIRVQDGNQSN